MKKIIISFFSYLTNKFNNKYFNRIDETSMWNCDPATSQSPIDIRYSSLENNLKIEETPHLEFLRTYYPPFNGLKLDDNLEIDLSKVYIAKAYTKYYNKTCNYIANKLRVHVYSEHSFELGKYDIEIQFMYFLEENNNEDKKIKCPKNLGISIFFSSQNNIKSNVINRFYKVNEDEKEDLFKRYILSQVSSIELSKYTNDKTGYYWYKGSGTFPPNLSFNCKDEVYWILFKKVRDMSEEELKGIITSTIDIYPDGNSRSTGYESKRNSQSIYTYYNDKFE